MFFKPSVCNDSNIVENLDVVSSDGILRVGRCGSHSIELENWSIHQDLSRFIDRLRKIDNLAKFYKVQVPRVRTFVVSTKEGALTESDYGLSKRLLYEMLKENVPSGIKEDFTFELESHLVLTILFGENFIPKDLKYNFKSLSHEDVCQRQWAPESYKLLCNSESLKNVKGYTRYSGWGLLPETVNFLNGSYLEMSMVQRHSLATALLPRFFGKSHFLKIDSPSMSYADAADLAQEKLKLLQKLKTQLEYIRI